MMIPGTVLDRLLQGMQGRATRGVHYGGRRHRDSQCEDSQRLYRDRSLPIGSLVDVSGNRPTT